MKRFIAIISILAMTILLAGCGGSSAETYSLGETVSTDTMEFTLHNAQLSYYADSMCEPAENEGAYASSKGSVLVCLDFELKNTDRVDYDTRFFTANRFTLQQGKNTVGLSDDDKFYFGKPVYSEIKGKWEANDAMNILMDPDSTVHVKYVATANFEPEDLNAPFTISVNLNSSEGSEDFTYAIE